MTAHGGYWSPRHKPLTLLPELLSLIFSHLPQSQLHTILLVNSYFYSVATPVLYKAPSFTQRNSLYLFAESLCSSIRGKCNGRLVKRLYVGEFWAQGGVGDEVLAMILRTVPMLEEISLIGCRRLTDKSMSLLGICCPRLSSINLEGCELSFRTLHEIAYHCRVLKTLNLRGCQSLPGMALIVFGKVASLEHINLTDCRWLSADQTTQDLQKLTKLQTLELINCSAVDDVFLQALISPANPLDISLISNPSIGFPQLTHLYLSGNADIHDSGLCPFLTVHPTIQDLSLACTSITDTSLKHIAATLSKLSALEVSFCPHITAVGIRHVIRKCPRLIVIGLKSCDKIDSDAFPELTDNLHDRDVQLNYLWYEDLEKIRRHEQELRHIVDWAESQNRRMAI
ncbi:hypothetical protein BZG36_00506 [Bifiguratus adelaidae]|uniref:F-box/LRR-repeat protein 15-like leucin rich repeat domain-containing protein n=1 Tax=Bifiguratus adelaidae TaxID=1938954 RepID=A0A261Y7H3_9FUNG|nr:hypothetical protein BZG36_00506 [Bifiguratus adelaidae]